MVSDVFEGRLAQWQAWCEAPWGRLRFAVVRETLRRQVQALEADLEQPRALRVLDVGGGEGRDALGLAVAGHHVTVLDPAPSWLAEARRRAESAGAGERLVTLEGSIDDLSGAGDGAGGGFDLVLCHNVLHYRPAETGAADVRRLARAARPGGRVSVMAPNPAARVIGRLVREGPEAALDELGRDDMESATFATIARAVARDEVEAQLVAAGLEVVGRYAARVANDYVADDGVKADPDFYAALERLELALCDREPFISLGALWQLVAARPVGEPGSRGRG